MTFSPTLLALKVAIEENTIALQQEEQAREKWMSFNQIGMLEHNYHLNLVALQIYRNAKERGRLTQIAYGVAHKAHEIATKLDVTEMCNDLTEADYWDGDESNLMQY